MRRLGADSPAAAAGCSTNRVHSKRSLISCSTASGPSRSLRCSATTSGDSRVATWIARSAMRSLVAKFSRARWTCGTARPQPS